MRIFNEAAGGARPWTAPDPPAFASALCDALKPARVDGDTDDASERSWFCFAGVCFADVDCNWPQLPKCKRLRAWLTNTQKCDRRWRRRSDA